MATSTAELKKVVREVLNEELGDANEATLKGIQRLTKLVTEQVIPKLPEEQEEEPGTGPGTGDGAPAATRSAATFRRAGKPSKPSPEKPELPGTPSGGEPPIGEVPETVVTAFEKLYHSLTGDQAEALSSLFNAISSEPPGDGDQPPETGEPGGATLAVTDGLVSMAKRKPAAFNRAYNALQPYVIEEDDGTFSISAPQRVIRAVDRDVYDALADSLEKANEIIRGGGSGEVGVRRRIPWGPIYRLVKKAGNWVWYKVHMCAAAVVRNAGKYPGHPGDTEWIIAAAADCGRAMK